MRLRSLNEFSSNIDKTITVRGWLNDFRDIGKIAFATLRFDNNLIQLVLDKRDVVSELTNIYAGSVLEVEGILKKSNSRDYTYEIVNPTVKILVKVKEPPPVEYYKKDLDINLDTDLDHRSLTLRNEKHRAIFKTQAGILRAFSESLIRQGFIQFRAPVLLGVPSESGADVFEVKYYDKKAYLAQSPQIHKQIMVGVFGKVFTIASAFRAEKHNTSRHIMELTQLDAEMGFIDSYDEILDVAEQTVRDIIKYLEENHSADIKTCGVTLPLLPKDKFPRIKVKEIHKLIEKETGKSSKREELDLDPEDEKFLGEWSKKNYSSDFVWVLNFKKNKNFYTWNNPDDPDESLSYDLVCRGLEWLSGTHRIHEYDKLIANMKEKGLTLEKYPHYLEAFKYGIPAEGGFSFGLERMTMQIFELKNIREATLFPSDLKRVAGQSIK
ncbi:aspartate--tRNA(Asn) ligase [Candidatus Dojkabacteria bacterium]|nr:aspartate--tRNA(Asn) ligase [Candidatus Dojkabacteria bacterium]